MAGKVLPKVPSARPGTTATKSTAPVWRERRPRLAEARCNLCGECLFFCPDGALTIEDGRLIINLELCKGCGICAHECRLKALTMVPEYAGEAGLLE